MEHVPSASSFKTTARCKHSFCRSCMFSYIMTTIGDGVAKVRCPAGLQCKARLNPLWCMELVSSKSFLMWCDLLCKSHLLGLARSYCLNSNCQEVIVNECEQSGPERDSSVLDVIGKVVSTVRGHGPKAIDVKLRMMWIFVY
ncbi:hypothetical protein NL676_023688 [Syzygium grande]|nr:hypothetical protein NL676_023688 [Syzygium grande]